MGKYMRKCKGIGEVAVMEVSPVGVRTRARALALATAGKRRRLSTGEFRTCRLAESPSQARKLSNSGRIPSDRCPSPDRIAVSRCSSNESSVLVNERLGSSDQNCFEDATQFDSRERRETTPSSNLRSESDDLESTARPFKTSTRRNSTAEMIPSESEIEAFFLAAEKNEQNRFAEKYNYDVENDIPLEGRYEWISL